MPLKSKCDCRKQRHAVFLLLCSALADGERLLRRAVQERRHLLGRLVVHLDTASIFEILVRLTGAEEQNAMYLPPSKVRCCALFLFNPIS